MNEQLRPMPPDGVHICRSMKKEGYYRLYWRDPSTHKPHSILEHIYVWQLVNGAIPIGYCLHHIDGNKANNEIENLECILIRDHSSLHNTKDGVNGLSQTDPKAYAKEYRLKNNEKRAQYNREWRKKNPEKYRLQQIKHKASGWKKRWREARRKAGLPVT
jgi:hypothetical protein